MNSLFSRFHSFLLFMGHPPYAIREVNINKFCKIISEFALEYRTTRERVLQQKQKRANHRERNKTRGKMITDVSGIIHLPQHRFLKRSFTECHIWSVVILLFLKGSATVNNELCSLRRQNFQVLDCVYFLLPY